jgi:hypothetical protein
MLWAISVQAEKPKNDKKEIIGTYTVNSCTQPISGTHQQIVLTIKEDHTFQLLDQTNLSKPIKTNGTWENNKNVILLKDYQSQFPIHSKWKIDPNYPCVKSRLGLEFTRICKSS